MSGEITFKEDVKQRFRCKLAAAIRSSSYVYVTFDQNGVKLSERSFNGYKIAYGFNKSGRAKNPDMIYFVNFPVSCKEDDAQNVLKLVSDSITDVSVDDVVFVSRKMLQESADEPIPSFLRYDLGRDDAFVLVQHPGYNTYNDAVKFLESSRKSATRERSVSRSKTLTIFSPDELVRIAQSFARSSASTTKSSSIREFIQSVPVGHYICVNRFSVSEKASSDGSRKRVYIKGLTSKSGLPKTSHAMLSKQDPVLSRCYYSANISEARSGSSENSQKSKKDKQDKATAAATAFLIQYNKEKGVANPENVVVPPIDKKVSARSLSRSASSPCRSSSQSTPTRK